jgi:5-methylcytosine-specific restriction endonuclease McrA
MALIALSRALVALVDEEDIDLVSVHRWHAKPCQRPAGAHYACAAVNGTTVYLHRYLMGATKGQFVDHINGDATDNSRSNLAVMCRSCHAIKTAKEDGGFGNRRNSRGPVGDP